MANYYNYQPEDFVQDSSFQHWVWSTSPEDTAFWEHFLLQHPEKAEVIEIASAMVRGLSFDKAPVDPHITQQDWRRLQASLRQSKNRKAWLDPSRMLPLYWRRVAAALVILLAAPFLFWWFNGARKESYSADYGEKQMLTLPDGSRVTLNAHSTLKVPRRWSVTGPREVWLNGEAFFEVNKQKRAGNPVKFVVHTANLDVEVLGTAFNVKHRLGRTQVTLEYGKVCLALHQPGALPLLMQPGEQAEYSPQQKLTKRLVHPREYSAWRQDQLILDGKVLADVARILEETYGRKAVFQEAGMAQIKLSGAYPLGNMDRFLKALAITTQLEITYTNTQIFFQYSKLNSFIR